MKREPKFLIFVCPQCGGTYKEFEGSAECCVGGHWTPHSSFDRIPAFGRCCHLYQGKIQGILLDSGCTVVRCGGCGFRHAPPLCELVPVSD